VFKTLSAINVNEYTEKKGYLTYLSWAHAIRVAKEKFPSLKTKVYENSDGLNYFHDGRTAYVKCSVTIGDTEEIEYLPVMDHKNKSIPVNGITSFNVNTAIKRCITKALSLHGLGLYIYAGEDLPQEQINTVAIKTKYLNYLQNKYKDEELNEQIKKAKGMTLEQMQEIMNG
tara:strand:+ start:4174 stop:4689 length:516 start_codon:yes stop_codon:yes gene_type:complete